MIATLFESWERREADLVELERLRNKYGAELVGELSARASAQGLASRDRRHWQRILKKAKAEYGA